SVTQEKLRQLAQRSGNFARYAEGVAGAAATSTSVARRVELLAEAARPRAEVLHDATGAIDLYRQALAQEGAGAHEQLMVSRRLSELYAQTAQPRQRPAVLAPL